MSEVYRETHHAVDQDAERNPEEQREGDDRSHDVVSQELPQRVDVQFIDEVPEALHHVLHLLHALPLQREHLHAPGDFKAPAPVLSALRGTYGSVAEAHGAGFAFTQEEEVAGCVLIGSADAAAAPAADFTRRVGFCGEEETRLKQVKLH